MLSVPKRVLRELVSLQRVAGLPCVIEYCARAAWNLPEILRSRNLAAADVSMAARRRRFKVFDRIITLDGSHFSGARELYARGVYFTMPGFQIRPTDVVVDLGANVGLFTVLAATLASKVVAVEAQSGFIEELRRNLRQNHCEGAVHVEFGLIGAGTGVFSDQARLTTASHFALSPPRLSMREIIDRHGLSVIDFLKVDIEGSEFDLLANDNEWLLLVEKIAMEVHADFGEVSRIASTLTERGFYVTMTNSEGRCVAGAENASGYLFATRGAPTQSATS